VGESVGLAWGAAVGEYVVAGAPPGAAVRWRNSFGLPLTSITISSTALASILAARISSGLTLPFWRNRAATLATCGDAIEVPLSVAVHVSQVNQAPKTPTPGAKMSTQVPKFEKDARRSNLSVR